MTTIWWNNGTFENNQQPAAAEMPIMRDEALEAIRTAGYLNLLIDAVGPEEGSVNNIRFMAPLWPIGAPIWTLLKTAANLDDAALAALQAQAVALRPPQGISNILGAELVVSRPARNYGFGKTAWGTGASGVLAFAYGVAPTTSPATTWQMWFDAAGAWVRSPAGVVTKIANF